MILKNKKINSKHSFTLIELIIVIVVIGLLAAMALPKFMGVQRNAKVGAMQRDLDTIEKAVQQYVSNSVDGDYPFIDLNGDNQINEDDLYFKTNPVPQTLTDSLLQSSGDDGSEIYQLDMNKLKPYIEKLKYKDTEYVYSPKSETAIDPIGKVDSEDNTHHIIGSGIVDNNENDKVTKSNKWTILSNGYYSGIFSLLETKDNGYLSLVNYSQTILEKRDKDGKLQWSIDKNDIHWSIEINDKPSAFELKSGNIALAFFNEPDISIYSSNGEFIKTISLEYLAQEEDTTIEMLKKKILQFASIQSASIFVENEVGYFTNWNNSILKGNINDVYDMKINNLEKISIGDENLTLTNVIKKDNKLIAIGWEVVVDKQVGVVYEYDLITKESSKVLEYFNSKEDFDHSEYMGIIVDKNNNFILCGRITSRTYKGVVEKYDSNWNKIYSKTIGDYFSALMFDTISLTSDNGFIIGGSGTCYNLGINTRKALLMKFDNLEEYEDIWK